MDKRTKIICTMGPSTEDDDIVRKMIENGMNVARFNFSHGDHAYHASGIERVRRVSDEVGVPIALMADTKGPEVRTMTNEGSASIPLIAGESVSLVADGNKSAQGRISIAYKALTNMLSPGSHVFIDDGLIELLVNEVSDGCARCTIMNGGILGERKGVNVPGIDLGLPPVTEDDVQDIRFACEMGMDAIAISFVCDESAPERVRQICKECGRDDMFLISKIESASAVKNFDRILEVSDGIMIARGDLGIEIASALVPHVQKEIIASCNHAYTPVITATQMLDSMTHNPRPTRAEVTDVANAILDGTDCVMLSGETAAGSYPIQSVQMMCEVCRQAESHLTERVTYYKHDRLSHISSATGFAAVNLARNVGAVAIVCPTLSGKTARVISSLRPNLPIYATTPLELTMRRTSFFWGVSGILSEERESLTRTAIGALKTCKAAGYINVDDIVVITAGDPLMSPVTAGNEISTNVCMAVQTW